MSTFIITGNGPDQIDVSSDPDPDQPRFTFRHPIQLFCLEDNPHSLD